MNVIDLDWINSSLRAINKDMERRVFRWKKNRFPQIADLSQLSELDGILIDFAGANGETEAGRTVAPDMLKVCRLSALKMCFCKGAG